MQISPLQSAVCASDLPVEQLANNSPAAESDKIRELSRQFEAVLLRHVLGNIQKTVIKSDVTEEAAGTDIYQDLVTSQLADAISRSGSFGLARSLEAELTRQLKSSPAETAEQTGSATPEP